MEFLAEIITGATILVGATVALFISILKGKKQIEENIPHKIKKQSGIDMEINCFLEELKERTGADRVQVYDFHNGGHYANGRSALKTSCTFEVTRTGIRPVQMKLQSIPISCIAKFVNQVLECGCVEVIKLEDIKEDMPATYQLKKDMGLVSFYDIVLNNQYDEPIGFLAVQFVKNEYKLSEDNKKEVLRTKYFVEKKLNEMNAKGK